MNLASKTIIPNSKTIMKLHPLAKQLNKLIVEAYVLGEQQDFLASMMSMFNCEKDIPMHNISLISQGSGTNEYQIIGGCFNLIFDIHNINSENSLFHSYRQLKRGSKAEFEQDIIAFIYLDFIRAISLLSLKKPGFMEPELRKLTKKYKSEVWSKLFKENNNYLRQIDYARLLDIKRDTISKQLK
tara:strand:- start:4666 stop:5220 length:555 start_codon:yes stop_codon:yes gene_type:complete